VQISNSCWELSFLEYGIICDGNLVQIESETNGSCDTFFNELDSAQGSFIDLESTVIGEL